MLTMYCVYNINYDDDNSINANISEDGNDDDVDDDVIWPQYVGHSDVCVCVRALQYSEYYISQLSVNQLMY